MRSGRHTWIAAAPLAICAGTEAQVLGSAAFTFPGGSVYSGGAPVAVELWISFEPSAFAWEGWQGDISDTDPFASWNGLSSHYTSLPGGAIGTPSSGSVVGISVGQVHYPPLGLFARTDNPIMIWSGEWSTMDLTPRTVEIETKTSKAAVYIMNGMTGVTLVVQEGVGQIQVIPSPGSAAVFLCSLGVVCVRRRRGGRWL